MDIISKAIIAVNNYKPADSKKQSEIAEVYQTLKNLLLQKYGNATDLSDAINKLETKPHSAGRKAMLEEEVRAVQANLDKQVQEVAQALLEMLQTRPNYVPPQLKELIPLQRPPAADNFVGREQELAAVLDSLRVEHAVAVWGEEGVGKTALAAAVVKKLAPDNTPPAQFPDGVVYHSFYIQPRVDIALEEIARSFGKEPIPSPYDAVEEALAGRKPLLVLDGIERADDASGILAVTSSAAVLVTSQQELELVTDQHPLNPLPLDQAVALLRDWATVPDQSQAERICELLGNLPLAIRLAGQFMSARKLNRGDMATWLEDSPLTAMPSQQRQQEAVQLLLKRSLSQISAIAQEALKVISLLAPVPFTVDVITKSVLTQPPPGLLSAIRGFFRHSSVAPQGPQVRTILQELSRYGLLQPVEDRYQVSHNLIYQYIRQHLSPSTKTIRNLANYFIALAWEQDLQTTDGISRLEADRPHFMKVMSECARWKEWNAAHGLAVAIEDYLDRNGHLADRVTANEIGLMAAWQLGRPNQGAWLGNLGDTYRTMGHAKWAIEHFNKALEVARQNGDPHSEGNSLGNLGLAYRDLGQIDLAITYLKQARVIFEELHSPSAGLVRDWLAELEEFEE